MDSVPVDIQTDFVAAVHELQQLTNQHACLILPLSAASALTILLDTLYPTQPSPTPQQALGASAASSTTTADFDYHWQPQYELLADSVISAKTAVIVVTPTLTVTCHHLVSRTGTATIPRIGTASQAVTATWTATASPVALPRSTPLSPPLRTSSARSSGPLISSRTQLRRHTRLPQLQIFHTSTKPSLHVSWILAHPALLPLLGVRMPGMLVLPPFTAADLLQTLMTTTTDESVLNIIILLRTSRVSLARGGEPGGHPHVKIQDPLRAQEGCLEKLWVDLNRCYSS
jgi:hypothetical protein